MIKFIDTVLSFIDSVVIAVVNYFTPEIEYFVVPSTCPVFWPADWAYDYLVTNDYLSFFPGDILVHNRTTGDTWKLEV